MDIKKILFKNYIALKLLNVFPDDVSQHIIKLQKLTYRLDQLNKHHRDDNIVFTEEGHLYTILNINKHPISVTTIIHKYFPEFDADKIIDKMMASRNFSTGKYAGKTKEQIKKQWDDEGKSASHLGTLMHQDIENFFNNDPILYPNSKEFLMFKNFWNDLLLKYPTLKPYRSEWIVYDTNILLSGSIDCVLENHLGELLILDWKRSKEIKFENRFEKGYYPFNHMDNCNFSHYSLQLNFYRHMLENIYGKKVIFMMLVILHPNQENYVCYPVNRIELGNVWNKIGSTSNYIPETQIY